MTEEELNDAIASIDWNGVVVKVWEATEDTSGAGRGHYSISSKCYRIIAGQGNEIVNPDATGMLRYPKFHFASHPQYLTKQFLGRIKGNTAPPIWEPCECCPDTRDEHSSLYIPLHNSLGKLGVGAPLGALYK